MVIKVSNQKLQTYSKKRNFKKTLEPTAKVKKGDGGELEFVVQKHAASHLHYDFRLECNGVLLSWAIPKGPSTNPLEKRLAVMVEDHPFDYKDFEGEIPKGEYGGGQVIVWDNGAYCPEELIGEQPDRDKAQHIVSEGIQKGKLSFVLHGKKLKGTWTLIKLKGSNNKNQWLLIKQNDKYASDTDITQQKKSVLTGKVIEEPKKA